MLNILIAAMVALTLACESAGERILVVPGSGREIVVADPFASPSSRLALYRACVGDHGDECACALLASGVPDHYTPGRMRTDPDTLRWLEGEIGLSCK